MNVECINGDFPFYEKGVIYEVQRQYIANRKNRGMHYTVIKVNNGASKRELTIDINEGVGDFKWFIKEGETV